MNRKQKNKNTRGLTRMATASWIMSGAKYEEN